MHLWWSFCTLCLLVHQVRVTVGDLGLCCCLCDIIWVLIKSLVGWCCTFHWFLCAGADLPAAVGQPRQGQLLHKLLPRQARPHYCSRSGAEQGCCSTHQILSCFRIFTGRAPVSTDNVCTSLSLHQLHGNRIRSPGHELSDWSAERGGRFWVAVEDVLPLHGFLARPQEAGRCGYWGSMEVRQMWV